MKKSQQVIGLPIISVSDGDEVGKVKNIIINAKTGTVDYFVVDSGVQILSTRVIAASDVLGIGEYALTIMTPEAIKDINKISEAIELIQKNVTVKSTKVLTKKGSLIGETGDIYLDENNGCSIVGLEYIADITQKRIKIMPRSCVITFGKNLIVVEDDVQEKLLDDPSDLSGSSGDMGNIEKKNIPLADTVKRDALSLDIDAEKDMGDISIESVAKEEVTADAEPFRSSEEDHNEDSSDSVQSSAADLFEERQRQYLNGRKATKDIFDNSGDIIIHAGEVIDDAAIDKAKESGKLVELVMNNES